ncbi:MAG: D-amino acid aminotransferase [Burkholderiaceae bacterium]
MATEQTVYLNGEFMPLSEAKVPVLDRGFIFGDGIYEVVPVYAGTPFRWPHHLARLKRSLAKISIDNPMTDEQWTGLVTDLVARHDWSDQFIYMQITRGVAKRDHRFPEQYTPTVFAMASEFVPVAPAVLETGIKTVTMPDERWLNCDIKSVSLLGNVLARQGAADAGATECLMFRDGLLTEGSSSNIWIVRDDQVFAPKRDRKILEGIRIGLMQELCDAAGMTLEFRNIPREHVVTADEILVTSATKEIVAATMLDGQPVGKGVPGPVFRRLLDAYQEAKRQARLATDSDSAKTATA